MSPVRQLLLRASVAAALLLAALVGLAFLPSVQTWVLERSLSARFSADLQLGRVRAVPGRLRIENLEFRTRGYSLQAPLVEAELSLYGLLRGRLECRSLVARGIQLRSMSAQPDAAAAPGILLPAVQGQAFLEALFPGDAPGLQVLDLGRLALDGEALFARPQGQPPARLRFSVDGGGVASGRTGLLNLHASSQASDAGTVARVTGDFELRLALGTEGRILKLEAQGGLEAEGGRLKAPARLGVLGLLEAKAAGQGFRLELSREGRRLLLLNGDRKRFPPGFGASWSLDLADADISPFLLGGGLPVFRLAGSGTLAREGAASQLHAAGHLEGVAEHLGRISPAWGDLGRVSLQSDFDLEGGGSLLRVGSLRLGLGAGAASLELRSERPFSADLTRHTLTPEPGQGRLLTVGLTSIPSEWIQRVVPGLGLSGGALGGSFAVECREDGWSVTSLSPVEGRGLGLALGGRSLLREVDLSLETRLDVLAAGWQVEVSKLRFSSGSDILVDGILRLGRLSADGSPLVSMGRLELGLAPLSSQPACGWLGPLTGGHASAEFQFSSSGRLESHGVLRVDGLAAPGQAEPLPSLSLELGLSRGEDGLLRIDAPLRIGEGGASGASDLLLSGSLRPGAPAFGIDLSVTSGRLLLAQLRPLVRVLLRPDPGPVVRAPGGAPAAGCPWSGFEGALQFSLAQCVVDEQRRLESVSGRLVLSPAGLALEQFHARQQPGSGGLQLDGLLGWQDGRFSLGAKFSADGLETGMLLQFIGTPGWNGLSGRFDAKGELKASASSLGGLMEDFTAQAEILSKGGTCRLLGTELTSLPVRKPGTVSVIASGLGALLGSKSAEPSHDASKLDQPSRMVLDLAEYFAQIPFDQLSFSLARDEAGDLQLQEISLISPLLRLSGSGVISHQPGTSLFRRPLDLRLNALVRGRFSEMLGKAGQLDGKQDPLGYNGFAEGIRIGGSLSNPDCSDLRTRLLKLSFSRSSDDFFRRLLGGR